jgi:hypothetical protein
LESPESAPVVWQKIDGICQYEHHFYAGQFYQYAALFSAYFCCRDGAGLYYAKVKNNLRRTAEVCGKYYTKPTGVFKCVGSGRVGSGSAAGRRALHFFAKNHTHTINIWTFDNISKSDGGKTVL